MILVAAIYLLLLRLIDLNEKEPLWLLGLFLGLGTMVGLLVHLLVPSTVLHLDLFGGTAVLELSRFSSIALGVSLVTVIEGWRGWREIDGMIDGIVLGAAAGLGVAVGGLLIQLADQPDISLVPVNELSQLGIVALYGLRGGLLGAIIGAGFAWSKRRGRKPTFGWLGGTIGLLMAIIAHILIQLLIQPAIDSGTTGVIRVWIGLLLPLSLVLYAIGHGLSTERSAIATQLRDEPEDVVSEDERRLLRSPMDRRRRYLSRFWRGNFDAWEAERTRHNLQVTLALVKSRDDRPPDDELQALRAAIRATRFNPEDFLGSTSAGADSG